MVRATGVGLLHVLVSHWMVARVAWIAGVGNAHYSLLTTPFFYVAAQR